VHPQSYSDVAGLTECSVLCCVMSLAEMINTIAEGRGCKNNFHTGGPRLTSIGLRRACSMVGRKSPQLCTCSPRGRPEPTS